jgi:dimeric dUTPase (all-alpha-NTP-PPase superfamily)
VNLSKLFEIQAEIDKPYQDVPDRLSKDILWLMTELGELANEWRGFRYRRPASEQTPVTDIGFKTTLSGIQIINPLLNEYTDALSVLLSIGLQVLDEEKRGKLDDRIWILLNDLITDDFEDIVELFSMAFDKCGDLSKHRNAWNYALTFDWFVVTGIKLGFTWDQIETAYIEKAEANKRRNAHA